MRRIDSRAEDWSAKAIERACAPSARCGRLRIRPGTTLQLLCTYDRRRSVKRGRDSITVHIVDEHDWRMGRTQLCSLERMREEKCKEDIRKGTGEGNEVGERYDARGGWRKRLSRVIASSPEAVT